GVLSVDDPVAFTAGGVPRRGGPRSGLPPRERRRRGGAEAPRRAGHLQRRSGREPHLGRVAAECLLVTAMGLRMVRGHSRPGSCRVIQVPTAHTPVGSCTVTNAPPGEPSLPAEIVPPFASTSAAAMANPKPAPPAFRPRALSPRLNRSKATGSNAR